MTTTREPEAATQEFGLASGIREQARERPAKTMIICGDRAITYGEMDRRSNRVAQGLAAEGVQPQDRIAFLDKNCIEYFEVLYGGGKLNVVDVGVNWRLAAPEMEFVINDAKAKVLFVGEEFFSQLAQFENNLTTVTKIVAIGDHPKYDGYESWLARQKDEDPNTPVGEEDVTLQLYTSGTTGMPKGAMLMNNNLGALEQVAPAWDFDETSVNLAAMPLFHIGGSGWALVGMSLGATTVLLRDPMPNLILEAIEQHRITNGFLVPALLNFLLQMPDVEKRDLSSLRSIVYGASPITVDVLKRAMATFKCKFIQVYGLTETTGAITELPASDHDPDGPRSDLLRSAGKPYPWVEIRIVDPATGKDQPRGEVGELFIRTAQNMKGYWGREKDTAAVMVDGWFRTGDAGYVDDEGYVFLTDRIKDMIVSGGENIYPIEIENALASHPDIDDVGVIGVPDDKWGETVKAIVVKRPGSEVSEGDIIAYARERLGGYKIPRSIDFVEALPRNPSGKILKKDLREPYWKGQERHIH